MNGMNSTLESQSPYGKPRPFISRKEMQEVIRLAVYSYDNDAQIQMLFEEMAELQNALCKLARKRGTADQVCEEIADVLIMCYQMAEIFGREQVKHWMNFKALRLRDRIIHSDNM